jgi:hypothetical protein
VLHTAHLEMRGKDEGVEVQIWLDGAEITSYDRCRRVLQGLKCLSLAMTPRDGLVAEKYHNL